MRSDRLVATGCLLLTGFEGRTTVEAGSDSVGVENSLEADMSLLPGKVFCFCFGGLPLTGISASLKSALKLAGLAFCQWLSWIFSTPDLKVPILTLIVE